MIIHIKQETTDSKDTYLKFVEFIEEMGYQIFDIGSYDNNNKLSEVILVDSNKVKIIESVDGKQEFQS